MWYVLVMVVVLLSVGYRVTLWVVTLCMSATKFVVGCDFCYVMLTGSITVHTVSVGYGVTLCVIIRYVMLTTTTTVTTKKCIVECRCKIILACLCQAWWAITRTS